MMEDYDCYSVMPSGSLVAEHTTLMSTNLGVVTMGIES